MRLNLLVVAAGESVEDVDDRLPRDVPAVPAVDDEIVEAADGEKRLLRVLRRRFAFSEEACTVPGSTSSKHRTYNGSNVIQRPYGSSCSTSTTTSRRDFALNSPTRTCARSPSLNDNAEHSCPAPCRED
jgi:hypothetical protein